MRKIDFFKIKPLSADNLSGRLPCRAGFTIIELILSLSILSVIVLLIGSSFRLGMNAWEKGSAETHETQRLRVLSGIMSQNLKSAYPFKIKIDREEVIMFNGKKDSLLFVTALADYTIGGFKWIRFSYDDESLMYKEGILPDKKVIEKVTGDEELVESDIKEFEFQYLSSDQSEWLESWDFGDELPSAVKVRIADFQPFLITIPLSKQKDEEEED